MEQSNIPPPTPEEATKATKAQRQLKDELAERADEPALADGHPAPPNGGAGK